MSAHLRLVTEEPAPLTAESARRAVGDLGQRFVLELMDALAALVDAHDDPTAAAREVAELRRNIVHVTSFTFDVALECADRPRRAQ